MTSLSRRAALAALAAACAPLNACDQKDDLVIVTYQHLGNAMKWAFGGKGAGSGADMWHVYMLRGVVNQGKDAAPFAFSLAKIALKDGETVDSAFSAMSAAEADPAATNYVMPRTFAAQVAAKSAFTVPYGKGVLFFIKETDDIEQTAYTTLTYKSAKGERVLMTPLDLKMAPVFGELNPAFLAQLHTKQNFFENNYLPDGKKA